MCKYCESKKRIRWDKTKCNEWLSVHGEGTLLIDSYTNSKEKLTFKCSCGNTFRRGWNSVKDKKQLKCNNCSNKEKGDKERKWNKELCNLWLSDNSDGTILLDDYTNNSDKLTFKCSCGNTFKRAWNNVYSQKQLKCNNCSIKGIVDKNRKRYTNKINLWLEKNGDGTILIDSYTNNRDNLTFKCSCGREFKRSWNSVKDQKAFKCEVCSNSIRWDKNKCNEWLNEFGEGTVLLEDYTNYIDKLLFRCSCGNTFKRRWTSIYNQRIVKCNTCLHATYSGEELTKEILNELEIEYIFQKTFKDLKNDGLLRVDFFITDKRYKPTKLEINGEFHYVPHFNGDETSLKAQQKRDEIKRKHSKKHGHEHIEIPYFNGGSLELDDGTILEGVTNGDKEELKAVIIQELEKVKIDDLPLSM